MLVGLSRSSDMDVDIELEGQCGCYDCKVGMEAGKSPLGHEGLGGRECQDASGMGANEARRVRTRMEERRGGASSQRGWKMTSIYGMDRAHPVYRQSSTKTADYHNYHPWTTTQYLLAAYSGLYIST